VGVEELRYEKARWDRSEATVVRGVVGQYERHVEACVTLPVPESFQPCRVSGCRLVSTGRDVALIEDEVFAPIIKYFSLDGEERSEVEAGPIDGNEGAEVETRDRHESVKSGHATGESLVSPEERGGVVFNVVTEQRPEKHSLSEDVTFRDTVYDTDFRFVRSSERRFDKNFHDGPELV